MNKKFVYGIILGVVIGGGVAAAMFNRIDTNLSEAARWKRDKKSDCLGRYESCGYADSVCSHNLDVCLVGVNQNYVGQ